MIEIPLQIIELEQDNFHILIEGHFDNEMPLYWIIDTGASKTVLDVNLNSFYEIIESDNIDDYQSAGINQGMMETRVGKMFRMHFGELIVDELKVALIDLSHVNDIYCKYTSIQIAGLLGGDILMKYKCLIDYDRKIIQFQN
jgi:hypothetical protein